MDTASVVVHRRRAIRGGDSLRLWSQLEVGRAAGTVPGMRDWLCISSEVGRHWR